MGAKEELEAFKLAEEQKLAAQAELVALTAAHQGCETCGGKPYQRHGPNGLTKWYCPEEM